MKLGHRQESIGNIKLAIVSHLARETAILKLRRAANQPREISRILSQTCLMEQASRGIEKIVTASLRRAPAGLGPLLAWPIACGGVVAARTVAVDFCDGVLRVQVPDNGWRAELKMLAPQYLAVINRYANSKVCRIEFLLDAGQR